MLGFEMGIIPQDTHHVNISRLATSSRLPGLLLFDFGPHFDDLVLVRWRNAGLL